MAKKLRYSITRNFCTFKERLGAGLGGVRRTLAVRQYPPEGCGPRVLSRWELLGLTKIPHTILVVSGFFKTYFYSKKNTPGYAQCLPYIKSERICQFLLNC